MELREKLIELIIECTRGVSRNLAKIIADHLLANGVVVLPCRCGGCEFCEDGDGLWCKHLKIGVSKYAYCSGGRRKDNIVDLCTTGHLHLGYVEEKGGDE